MSSSRSDWEKFFKDAGIPSKLVSEYANIFSENRMRLNMLEDFSKEVLQELGIKAFGDILAILKHAKTRQKELQRRSPSPDCEIVTKKPTSSASAASSAKQKSLVGPKIPPKLSMTVNADSSSTKKSSKANRKTLSDRFNDYEKEAKQKKIQEHDTESSVKAEATTSTKTKSSNNKPNQTVFTIQLPSKQPSIKQIATSSKTITTISKMSTSTATAPPPAKKKTQAPQKVTLVPAQGKTLNRNKQSTSIFDRLDRLTKNTQEPTTNSKKLTKTVVVNPKPGVFSRLGDMEDEESSTNETASSSSKNVFSRLGDMDE